MKDQVYQMMDNVQEIFRAKSARMSNSRRLEAEHLHKIGKIDKALTMYTQSIIRAPAAGKLNFLLYLSKELILCSYLQFTCHV